MTDTRVLSKNKILQSTQCKTFKCQRCRAKQRPYMEADFRMSPGTKLGDEEKISKDILKCQFVKSLQTLQPWYRQLIPDTSERRQLRRGARNQLLPVVSPDGTRCRNAGPRHVGDVRMGFDMLPQR